MSSCPTAPTSTTASSRNSPSRAEAPVLVIACGALGAHLREIIARRGWPAELHCLPALLHNRPEKITIHAERLARAGLARGQRVAVAYADCGTYGALDELCARLGLRRLPGLHCYDVLAGPERIRAEFEAEPGTYVLTDFLVRSFAKTVLAELGLDRYPELWPDYFGHYRRLVWLAQDRDPGLEAEAGRVAARFGLPLTVVDTGTSRLERELEALLAGETGEGMGSLAPTATKECGRWRNRPQTMGAGGAAGVPASRERGPAVARRVPDRLSWLAQPSQKNVVVAPTMTNDAIHGRAVARGGPGITSRPGTGSRP
jgi:hypothetical protein